MKRLSIGISTTALVFCCLQWVSAQSFQVTNVTINAQGKCAVSFPSDPNDYFILNRGTLVSSITSPVAMVLGQGGSGQLTDTVVAVGVAFFKVQKVPLSAPHDTDGDGIDDAYELQHGLNPLSPADAAIDSDGDGVSNYDEYRRGTDPNNSTSVNISLYVDSVIGSDANDGIASSPISWFGGMHAPKLTIQGGIAVGVNGDSVSIASGTFHDTLLDAGAKSITLLPQGNVIIQ